MRRLMRDACLIGITAAAVWFIRGDAQQTEPVPYAVPVQIVCQAGELTTAQVGQTPSGFTISWRDTGITQSAFQQRAMFQNCAIYPWIGGGEDVGP